MNVTETTDPRTALLLLMGRTVIDIPSTVTLDGEFVGFTLTFDDHSMLTAKTDGTIRLERKRIL